MWSITGTYCNTCGPLPNILRLITYGKPANIYCRLNFRRYLSQVIKKIFFIKSALLHYKYITVPLQKIPLKKVIIEKFKKSPLYKKSYVNFFKQNYYRYKKTVFKKITDPYTYHSIRAITNLTN